MVALAVVRTGGKQYLMKTGDVLRVEKLPAEKAVVFQDVLLMTDENGRVVLGKPYLAGMAIEAKTEHTGHRPKVLVIKFKAKTRYRVKRGHRQPYSQVKVGKI